MSRYILVTVSLLVLEPLAAVAQEPSRDVQTEASVGFLGMLIIGLVAGWIAEKITSSDHGLLTNLLVGIAGSFVGGTLAGLMNIQFNGWVGNLIVAAIGAVLILWLWRLVTARRTA
jgi:uncharacterized membrane protein YeaQ/YmgE (transglycosylase-associated protein family)